MNNLLKHSCTFLIAAYLIGSLHAQPIAPPSTATDMLPGNHVSNQDAAKRSSDILVASFKNLGTLTPGGSGALSYEKGQIEITSSFKGSLSGKVTVLFTLTAIPGIHEEKPPILGTSYLMFVEKVGPKEGEILKFLEATVENIAVAKALVLPPRAKLCFAWGEASGWGEADPPAEHPRLRNRVSLPLAKKVDGKWIHDPDNADVLEPNNTGIP